MNTLAIITIVWIVLSIFISLFIGKLIKSGDK